MVNVGDNAPNFKSEALVGGQAKEIDLSNFKGSKVALYFYPKDMTPGCTTQACNLRDNFNLLGKKGITVLGVSIDSIARHVKFADKESLPYILVSDEDKKIVESYGVWAEKSMYGRKYMGTLRKTFLINENGKVVSIIEKPKVSDHASEILEGFGIK